MSYTKHDFKSGEKLYAQQLNEMDEQIFKNTEETSKLSEEKVYLPKDADGKPLNGTVGQFATSDGNGGIAWVTVQNGSEVAW